MVPLVVLLQRRIRIVAERYTPAPRSASPARGLLMFLLPLPVLLAAVGALMHGDLTGLSDNGICYGLFLGGALLLRRGLRLQTLWRGKVGSGRRAAVSPVFDRARQERQDDDGQDDQRKILFDERQVAEEAVSYTHLDVYKRQGVIPGESFQADAR